MALRKITFNESPVRARDHGALFSGILADGIINGCEVSVNNGSASISQGYLIVAGRLIENNSNMQNINISGGNVAQIVLRIDISSDDVDLNNSIFVRHAPDVSSLDPLTKMDINNGTDTIYEFEIAVIDVTNNTIIRKMPICARPIHVLNSIPASWNDRPDGIYLIKEE